MQKKRLLEPKPIKYCNFCGGIVTRKHSILFCSDECFRLNQIKKSNRSFKVYKEFLKENGLTTTQLAEYGIVFLREHPEIVEVLRLNNTILKSNEYKEQRKKERKEYNSTEKMKKYKKEWTEENKEKLKEKYNVYYEKNKEQAKLRAKLYSKKKWEENPELIKQKHREADKSKSVSTTCNMKTNI